MDFSMLNMQPVSDGSRPSSSANERRSRKLEHESKEDWRAVPASEEDEIGRSIGKNFYNWREVFPELQILFDNQEMIKEEIQSIPKWVPWPEDHFALPNDYGNTKDWTVFPLVHTFPAFDESKKQWVQSTCAHCPKTTELLRQLPTLRTALFSKLGPGTQLSSHTGWADLANYVLRCHLCLHLPADGNCGLLVNGEVQYHKQGQLMVFDDSRPHRAFNNSEVDSRVVLIVDLLRPRYIPLGSATGTHTPELDSFMSLFK